MKNEIEKIAAAVAEAGALEVYATYDRSELRNFHTDSVGEYVGDSLTDIPADCEDLYWEVMNAEEYDQTLLANCGGDPADFVCPETGKIVVVQFLKKGE